MRSLLTIRKALEKRGNEGGGGKRQLGVSMQYSANTSLGNYLIVWPNSLLLIDHKIWQSENQQTAMVLQMLYCIQPETGFDQLCNVIRK